MACHRRIQPSQQASFVLFSGRDPHSSLVLSHCGIVAFVKLQPVYVSAVKFEAVVESGFEADLLHYSSFSTLRVNSDV